MSSTTEKLELAKAVAALNALPVEAFDPQPGDPDQLAQLVVDGGVPPPLTSEQRIALMRERQGHLQLREAFKNRDPHRAAKPSGVRMRDGRGMEYDVCDDGSIRKPYKRAPGLSGRQFRKLRKKANKAIRAREREQEPQI